MNINRSSPVKHWWLLVLRGLLYILLGGSILIRTGSFPNQSAQLPGGLLIAAGLCGCIYAVYILRTDRNYFWELLRSVFDIGFGIALLAFSAGSEPRSADILGFWAVVYAFIHVVQAIYIFMLLGGKQPRNILGNLLHMFNVLLSGGIAYAILSSDDEAISTTLIGSFICGLGVSIILLAIQQRTILLANKLI
ncbi:hypothetical protein [Spirosoma litoris]